MTPRPLESIGMQSIHQQIMLGRHTVSRRSFLRSVSAASIAAGTLGFRDVLSVQADELRRQGRSMILLWMAGGPSQFETFDPKPGHANGGPTTVIDTAVPGIQIASGWDSTAGVMDEIALIRSMTNREGNHQRATYQMHTGYIPSGSVKHPSFASAVTKELADPSADLPSFVSIGPTVGSGFLGVDYDPFVVNNPGQSPQNLTSPAAEPRYRRRLGLLNDLEQEFADKGAETVVRNHRQIYGKASDLVLSPRTEVFDFSDESPALVDSYGDSQFGRGCLLARRLIETGVTFVEVRSNGWDTHQDNFERTSELAAQTDPAVGTLIRDLRDRGLLDSTLVVWMGEFGRTAQINPRTGRDHNPRVFSAALAGSGVRGGQVIGNSTADGSAVADRPVAPGDLLASFCHSLGVDPRIENISPLGRPMRIVDEGEVVNELFG